MVGLPCDINRLLVDLQLEMPGAQACAIPGSWNGRRMFMLLIVVFMVQIPQI
jgi:hypothetical protein